MSTISQTVASEPSCVQDLSPSNSGARVRRTPAEAESEFANAIQDYKRRSGRLFPTWSEVLEVAVNLGYTKPD